MKLSGIYAIVHIASGKRYVGSAIDLRARSDQHKRALSTQRHGNRLLQRAWNKYGEGAFQFVILEYCKTELLLEAEQRYIDERSEYNLSPTARSPLGVRHTKETKAKYSAAAKIRMQYIAPSTRKKWSIAAKKQLGDPRQLAALIAAHTAPEATAKANAAKRTPEYRAQRSAIAKALWANPKYRSKHWITKRRAA